MGHAPLESFQCEGPFPKQLAKCVDLTLDVNDRLLSWCRDGEESGSIHNGSTVSAKGGRQYARASSMAWSYHVDHPHLAFG